MKKNLNYFMLIFYFILVSLLSSFGQNVPDFSQYVEYNIVGNDYETLLRNEKDEAGEDLIYIPTPPGFSDVSASKHWYWIDSDKRFISFIGRIKKSEYYDEIFCNDGDINIFIKPSPKFSWCLTNSHSNLNEIQDDIDDVVIEGEISHDYSFIKHNFLEKNEIDDIFKRGDKIWISGFWVEDGGHDNKTEIHPIQEIIKPYHVSKLYIYGKSFYWFVGQDISEVCDGSDRRFRVAYYPINLTRQIPLPENRKQFNVANNQFIYEYNALVEHRTSYKAAITTSLDSRPYHSRIFRTIKMNPQEGVINSYFQYTLFKFPINTNLRFTNEGSTRKLNIDLTLNINETQPSGESRISNVLEIMNSTPLNYKVYNGRSLEIREEGNIVKTNPLVITINYPSDEIINDTLWRVNFSGLLRPSYPYRENYCEYTTPDTFKECVDYSLFMNKNLEFFINPSKCNIKVKETSTKNSTQIVIQSFRVTDSIENKISLIQGVNLIENPQMYLVLLTDNDGNSYEVDAGFYSNYSYSISNSSGTMEGGLPYLINHSFSNEYFDLQYDQYNNSVVINWKIDSESSFISSTQFNFVTKAKTDIGEFLIDIVPLKHRQMRNPNNISMLIPIFTVDFVAAYQTVASGRVNRNTENKELFEQEMNNFKRIKSKYAKKINDNTIESLPKVYFDNFSAITKYMNGEPLTNHEVDLLMKSYERSKNFRMSKRTKKKINKSTYNIN